MTDAKLLSQQIWVVKLVKYIIEKKNFKSLNPNIRLALNIEFPF